MNNNNNNNGGGHWIGVNNLLLFNNAEIFN